MAAARGSAAASVGVSPEVLHLVKAQRRVRGTVSAVSPEGRCQLTSQYGVFAFDVRSVKPNKNHPDRKPQVGDPCEFRLSHHMPPTAVSIRVAVPKRQRDTPAPAEQADPKPECPQKPLPAPVPANESPLTLHDPALKHCRRVLEEICGGIAPLVQRLDTALCAAVTVLMLQVRALDGIDKTTTLPATVRSLVLKELPQHLTGADTFIVDLKGCATRECDQLLFGGFDHVSSVYRRLSGEQRQIIYEAISRRGEAMGEWQGREVVTLQEHTEYCRAVGGEVSRGIAALCGQQLGRQLDTAQATAPGILIEKVAAMAGYMEEGRRQWPREVWGRSFSNFADLASRSRRADAVQALNSLLSDALSHVADAVSFLSLLVDSPAMFSLVAVPATLAMVDMSQLCSNHRAFTSQVGADSDEALQIQQLSHPREAASWMGNALVECQARMPCEDPFSYTVSLHVDRSLQALRRLDAAAASQAPMVGGSQSVTRQFLTGQGAALGGKLLYSMLDSLHTVFEAGPPPAAEPFAYDPYEPGMGMAAARPRRQMSFSSDEGDEQEATAPAGGGRRLISAVASSLWGLGCRFMGKSHGREDAFMSFYDGGAAPDASDSGSVATARAADDADFVSAADIEDLQGCRPRARSVSPHRSPVSTVQPAERRSRTP
eukprot:TRINITY_DN3130_c0_g1_i1.p1 TRINITY_DN3130_c0_g1~~TRINITY_DN3130_c0_g1_i1.p1  ORF type:complete len:687 (+),score=208.67 TRINITY_DN3130_c0_g1_i1:84-2063(+)